MKRLATALALALALASPALAAPTIHKDVLGTWCEPYTIETTKETVYSELPSSGKCPNAEEEFIWIKPNRYGGRESECRVIAVRTWFDRGIIGSTKTMGALRSQVTATCTGEACRWREQVSFYIQKGTFTVKSHWRSKEKCE
jgi:hypothetical protein